MAGYYEYSMSNNAVDAYNAGLLPASKLAKKLKVTTSAIKLFMSPSEWHHTSSNFNKTNFYDGEIYLQLINNTVNWFDYDYEDIELAAYNLCCMHNYTPCENKPEIKYGRIEWIEWSGSRRYPKAIEREFVGNVTIKGEFYYFANMKKKINGNYVHFFELEK